MVNDELLTRDEVERLRAGDEVIVRWKNKRHAVRRTVEIHFDYPHVRETKPSGFPALIPLRPVFSEENPNGVKIWWPHHD